ncbi:unnamed protein product, partial [Nesidiocoris tenuis]
MNFGSFKFSPDKRESRCYKSVTTLDGRSSCSQETGHPVTKATCCCTLGKAWGSRCELCPEYGSKEFRDLCPAGQGYRPNEHTMKMNASDLQALVEGMHNASTLRAASNASVLMVTNWACRTGTAS